MAPSYHVVLDENVSDSESSFESIKPPRKRKAAAGRASAAKKAKVVSLADTSSNIGILDKHSSVLATSVLSNGVEFYKDAENQEDAAKAVVKLAQYTKQLEAALAQSKSAGGATEGATAAKQRTKAELEADAEKIRKAAVSGIKKQMTWRPSCRTNEAKWTYDGLCADADLFGVVMRLDGPPTWKMKKFTKEYFVDVFGSISSSARYSTLRINGTAVYVWYDSDSGEFKFSGRYGTGY